MVTPSPDLSRLSEFHCAIEDTVLYYCTVEVYCTCQPLLRSLANDGQRLEVVNGSLNWWQEQSVMLGCDLEFSLFPMDSHSCEVTVDPAFHRIDEVVFDSTFRMSEREQQRVLPYSVGDEHTMRPLVVLMIKAPELCIFGPRPTLGLRPHRVDGSLFVRM